ncbi:MAG: MBL fold metallo-hydrolase [Thermodesulfobacteriota bacterium]
MKLTILGSGTCVLYTKRGSSGYAIETSGVRMLLDCGSGTTWRLADAGINYLLIDHIILSHLHPDHTGDLVPFLFATKYAYGPPYGSKREKPLSLWGGRGFIKFFEALKNAYDDWITLDELSVRELGEGLNDFGEFSISAVRTPHIESSLALRIEAEGKILVYSGDTDYSEALVEFSRDADALLIECALPDEESKRSGHLTPGEVIDIANKSGARKIIVTHLYPLCDETNVVDRIRRNLSAEVIEAQDLLVVEI